MKGSNLKPLMIPRFPDQKLLKRSNTFGISRSGGFGIELSVSITLCNALLVVTVQIVLAVAEGGRCYQRRGPSCTFVVENKGRARRSRQNCAA